MNKIFYYNLKYSIKNAIDTDININLMFSYINEFPNSGRVVVSLRNKNFREIIYRKTKHSVYRIIYYIQKRRILIVYVLNSKQNFNQLLISMNFREY